MNKYIDDLACSVLDDMSADGDWFVPDEFIEKFAILIADECLSYINEGGADFAKFMINVNFKTQGATDELKVMNEQYIDLEIKSEKPVVVVDDNIWRKIDNHVLAEIEKLKENK